MSLEDKENLSSYLSIVSLEDISTISLPINTYPDLMYSLDGINWIQWNYSTIQLNNGDILYLKGNNSNGFSSTSSKNNFSITINILSIEII